MRYVRTQVCVQNMFYDRIIMTKKTFVLIDNLNDDRPLCQLFQDVQMSVGNEKKKKLR